MTNRPPEPRTSPHAAEFLPDEIDKLERGTMVLCARCLWPRPVNRACHHCAGREPDASRDPRQDFADPP